MPKIRTTIYIAEELWEKAKKIAQRDGYKLSNILEELLENWVRAKDPGNPQRPITAYMDGHPDRITAIRQEALKQAREIAEWRGEITFTQILNLLREIPYPTKYQEAEKIASQLYKEGFRVWR